MREFALIGYNMVVFRLSFFLEFYPGHVYSSFRGVKFPPDYSARPGALWPMVMLAAHPHVNKLSLFRT